jgi:hypothetical protein
LLQKLFFQIKEIKFESKVLRAIFETQKKKGRKSWVRMHEEKLLKFHFSLNIITVIKSKMIRSTDDLARVRKKREASKFCMGQTERKGLFRRIKTWTGNVIL